MRAFYEVAQARQRYPQPERPLQWTAMLTAEQLPRPFALEPERPTGFHGDDFLRLPLGASVRPG